MKARLKAPAMLVPPWSQRFSFFGVFLLGFLWLAAKPEHPGPGRRLLISAGQAQIRSLEKWRPGTARLIPSSGPDARSAAKSGSARLVFQPEGPMPEPIQKGQAARVKLPAPREGYLLGVVDRADHQVELIVENPNQVLSPAGTYSAEIQVVKRPNALVIPRAAVLWEEGRTHVFRLSRGLGEAQVEKLAVPIGYVSDEWVEVLTGLWPGQWLATSHLNLLPDQGAVWVQAGPR